MEVATVGPTWRRPVNRRAKKAPDPGGRVASSPTRLCRRSTAYVTPVWARGTGDQLEGHRPTGIDPLRVGDAHEERPVRGTWPHPRHSDSRRPQLSVPWGMMRSVGNRGDFRSWPGAAVSPLRPQVSSGGGRRCPETGPVGWPITTSTWGVMRRTAGADRPGRPSCRHPPTKPPPGDGRREGITCRSWRNLRRRNGGRGEDGSHPGGSVETRFLRGKTRPRATTADDRGGSDRGHLRAGTWEANHPGLSGRYCPPANQR